MAGQLIMIIRHAEKPSVDGTIQGVEINGTPEKRELIVQGWQRAGALVRLFAPANGVFARAGIATPKTIFATKADKSSMNDDADFADSTDKKGSKSRRPIDTVTPLVASLGSGVTTDFDIDAGDEKKLALRAVAATVGGPVLVAWHHEKIPTIVDLIVGNATTCPRTWTGSRFDVIWTLSRSGASAPWAFAQVPQLVLAGDSDLPI